MKNRSGSAVRRTSGPDPAGRSGLVPTSSWSRHYGLAAVVLALLVTSATCWPILASPHLDPDDFRYLHHLQQLERDSSRSWIEAGIVENRWDHLWWLATHERVRFFRPMVVASYGLDRALWGERVSFGLTLTNVLLHLACTLLVAFLLARWFGKGGPALLGTALFAGIAAHAECLWYIAGRTDTLAALGFLGAFALHLGGERHPWMRWAGVPVFAVGFLTKELVVALPLVLLLNERLVRGRSWRRILGEEVWLWVAYALTGALVLILKQLALAGAARGLVYPYFVSPTNPDFAAHLWRQARSYTGNLLLGEATAPFAGPRELQVFQSAWGLPLFGLLLAATAWLARRDRRLLLMLALGFLTWLPTSFVYLSERFLYLPSLAFAGLFVLLVTRLSAPRFRLLALVGLAGFVVFQGGVLLRKHTIVAAIAGGPAAMERQIRALRPPIPKGARLLVLNLPGDLLQAQFAEDQLRVQLDDAELEVRVLTIMPGQDVLSPLPRDPVMGAGQTIRREGPRSFVVEGLRIPGQRRHLVQEIGRVPFPWASLATGAKHEARDLVVEVREGDGKQASALAFTLPEPLERYILLDWQADPDPRKTPAVRQEKGRLRIVTPR